VSEEFAGALNDLREFLLGIADPGLFRANAFRIVGLPANSSDSAIRKQAKKLEFEAQHQNGAGNNAGPLPLAGDDSRELLPDAMQRLKDPERRFVEEFFWFWPRPRLGNDDPAIAALAKRDIATAIEVWTGEVGRDDDYGRACHNLAVMFHTLALDVEYARQFEETAGLQKLQCSYWEKGFEHWQSVLSDDAFWNEWDTRVSELNDPRLTTSTTQQLRAALPTILLLINAQIAGNASARGAAAEAQGYRRLMEASGFDCAVVEEACARAALQTREQINSLCHAAEQEAATAPASADEGVRRLLDQSRSLLARIDILLGNDSALSNEARDEIADAVTNNLLLYCEESGSWAIGRELLDATRPYAVSLAVRERIDYLRSQFLRHAYSAG
jgi:hypothetical protein